MLRRTRGNGEKGEGGRGRRGVGKGKKVRENLISGLVLYTVLCSVGKN